MKHLTYPILSLLALALSGCASSSPQESSDALFAFELQEARLEAVEDAPEEDRLELLNSIQGHQ